MWTLLLSCVVITDGDIASKVGEGTVDCTSPSTFFADADGDGFGDAAVPLETCSEPPASYVADATDCDDASKAVNPTVVEICNGIDDDCSGTIDDNATDATTWYADADQDGVGDESTAVVACEAPESHVAGAGDCDDYDNDVGLPTVAYQDADADGYGDDATAYDDCTGTGVTEGGDCDDTRADIHPGASEDSCTDATDYNCDGSTGYDDNDGDGLAACQDCDDGDASVTTGATYYADLDGDGAGDDASTMIACNAPEGHAATGGDCDDLDPARFPGAAELCDGVDNDCDEATSDDDTLGSLWYADTDVDGYGDPSASVTSCEQPAGYTADDSDCDDTSTLFNPAALEEDCSDPADYNCDGSTGFDDNDGDGFAACEECDDTDAAAYPGAEETCDGNDDDCDGEVDESDAVDPSTWYADTDGDGYGDADSPVNACDAPVGYTADDADCDDTSASVNPGALEVCNDLDDDCDGDADSGAADASTWYADDDGDGYGDDGDTTRECDSPDGYSGVGGDCDDSSADYNPAATEDDCADPEDYNCDGATGYADADGDGYAACEDCDDSSAAVNPGEAEDCATSDDDDCSGSANDTGATGCTMFYADSDADGYGTTSSQCTCTASGSYTAENDDDCDDSDAGDNPAATETVGNGDDEDCSGAETCYDDDDDDGFLDSSGDTRASTDNDCSDANEGTASDPTTDCDDADSDTFPGAASSDSTTACMNDDDGDNYGDATASGSVTAGTDCDDSRSAVKPGATETCSTSYDDDCDGSTNDTGATGCTTYYYDADADGYGTPSSQCTCTASGDYDATLSADCDDGDAGDNPAASETVGNGDDEDCDGYETCYDDDDNDGYLDATGDTVASSDTDCSDTNEGTSGDATTDCDDADADTFPGAASSESATACMNDDDGDNYGDASVSSGVTAGTDCDDTRSSVLPGAAETCATTYDDDCDGSTNDAGATSCTTYYYDADNDGYGSTTSQCTCTTSGSYDVMLSTDCDDASSSDYPGATETVANGDDEDCDGAEICYDDDDNDGYLDTTGDTRTSTDTDCSDTNEGTSTDLTTDCDDASSSDYPGATETVGNGDDEDCDGAETCYDDDDNDGYLDTTGDTRSSTDTDCSDANEGTSSDATTDCDDSDADTFVGSAASELTTSCTNDDDNDGYGDATTSASYVEGTDCDDADSSTSPGDTEVCNDGVDNDCDGGSGSCGPSSASLSTAVQYTGEAAGDYGGYDVAGAGDVNGDGYDDLLVGASENDDGGSSAGTTYLVLGGVSAASASLSGAIQFTGEAISDYAGRAVSGAGDVDGDGYHDILVGVAFDDDGGTLAGAAYLVFGGPSPASASLSAAVQYTGEAPYDYVGTSVSGAGDVDGDGYDDVLVGAEGNDAGGSQAGAAYVLFGGASPASASLTAAVQYSGGAAGDAAGWSVSGAGDVDGDGYDDALVGAYGQDAGGSSAGAAYLVLGGTSPASGSLTAAVRYSGEATGDSAGRAVAGADDIDGDGYDDFLVGATGNDDAGSGAGAAYLVFGGPSATAASLSTAVQYSGEAAGDAAGKSVAGAGDVDGDGYFDVLVAASGNDDGGSGAGAAYLVLVGAAPAPASLSTAVQFTGEAASDEAGQSVAGAGDVNADGYFDVLVGAHHNDDGGTSAGAAYLILGQGL